MSTLPTFSKISELRSQIHAWRMAGQRIAFVPTMGNLHVGHLSLIEKARALGDKVVASIFVNPTQFGPSEDYTSYPRTLEADQALLLGGGCDLLFAPEASEMYPRRIPKQIPGEPEFSIAVGRLGEVLCGAVRPGHFAGVATVVAKLFNIVQPDVAVFGEKDFQQLMVIRKLVEQFDFPVEIVGAPTKREANGLACSSRNQYLSDEQRALARIIYATLLQMRDNSQQGLTIEAIEAKADQALRSAGLNPDYARLLDAKSLDLIDENTNSRVALIAAKLGRARLIDNIFWDQPG